ncbi:hypothetical protein TIFTF001_025379 [Ficus carica]|uniref:Uncharacterized protein n=1 Tax=Ficus carica TaxID=3494 RepID=A0AA88DGL1_FICCA|nr:hypothetical protein TIFTF001_025379 [Ficus carica]
MGDPRRGWGAGGGGSRERGEERKGKRERGREKGGGRVPSGAVSGGGRGGAAGAVGVGVGKREKGEERERGGSPVAGQLVVGKRERGREREEKREKGEERERGVAGGQPAGGGSLASVAGDGEDLRMISIHGTLSICRRSPFSWRQHKINVLLCRRNHVRIFLVIDRPRGADLVVVHCDFLP